MASGDDWVHISEGPALKNTTVSVTSQPHWILSIALTAFNILVNSWIAFAFIYHAIGAKMMKKKSSRDMNGGLVSKMAMATVITPFARYFSTLSLILVGTDPQSSGCEIAADFCLVGYVIALCPVYVFLWARQRAFYSHPSLGYMFGKCVSVFSKLSLGLIVLLAIVVVSLGIYPVDYQSGRNGCELIGLEEQNQYRTYLYAVVTILSQITLLGLLLYPIYVHSRAQANFEGSGEPTTKAESKSEFSVSEESGTSTNTQKDKPEVIGSVSNTEEICLEDVNHDPSGELENEDNAESKDNASGKPPPQAAPFKQSQELTSQTSNNGIGQAALQAVPVEDKHKRYQYRASKVSLPRAVSKRLKRKIRTTVRTKRVYRLIRRTVYLAMVSVASDLLVMILIGFVIPDTTPQDITFVVYDVNALINVFTVMGCFTDWRKMMTSPC